MNADQLPQVIRALWQGYKLKHARTWGEWSAAAAAFTPAALLLVSWAQSNGWLPEGVTKEDVSELANVVSVVVMFALAYFMQATNKDAGFQGREADVPPVLPPAEAIEDNPEGGAIDPVWRSKKYRLHEDDE